MAILARRSVAWTAALFCAASLAACVRVRTSSDDRVLSAPTPNVAAPIEATGGEIVTPGPDQVLTPMFQSEQAVLDFVTAQLAGTADTAEVHARRTTYGAFSTMTFGPGAAWPTNPPGQSPAVQEPQRLDSLVGQQPVWVAGVRTTVPTNSDLVLSRLGALVMPTSQAAGAATEFYAVYDDLGNVVESGVLAGIGEDGASWRAAPWSVADVDTLPTP